MPVRQLTIDVVRSFQRIGLVNFASAIAFRVVLSVVPFLLFPFALIGFLDLEEIWRHDVAPELKKSASEAAYRLVNETVALGAAMGICAVAAFAIVRWLLAAAVLALGVGLLVRYGSATRQPLPLGVFGGRRVGGRF